MVECGLNLLKGEAVFAPEVQAEAFVQRLDDPRKRFQFFAQYGARLATGGVERLRVAFKGDPAAARSLDAVGLHVDALLNFDRQLVAGGGQQPPQVSGEYVELLQVGIGECQHLGEKGVHAHVVR